MRVQKIYSNNVMSELTARLQQAASLLIITHGRPDGDGLGSMIALATAARAMGKTVHTLVPDRVPPRYEYFFEECPAADPSQSETLAEASDLVVVLDTCAFAQLDGLGAMLKAHREKIVVIDHHATADDVGSLRWQDTSAAATGVMVTELIEALDWPISSETAEALMTAITTDTGWLRFANTDGRCLRVVADLVDAGVRPDKLYQKIYQTDRPHRLELLRRMLGNLELHCSGRLAAMTIRSIDFEVTGARPDETENLVNEALRIGKVDTAILLVENTDCIRVSLRSRDRVDVASVARQFGGGGHHRAAGLRRAGDIETLKGELVAACAQALEASDS